MLEENKIEKIKKCHPMKCGGAGGAVYGLGLIGAAVYYIQNAETFWLGALGILKALVWPAMIIYQLMKFFNM